MTHPDLASLREIFRRAAFVADVGMELEEIAKGECVTSLNVDPRHLQQTGQVHAGVLATMADHSAGAAAQTLAAEGSFVVTAELKISLLRPAKAERLVCRARVLKAGRQLTFAEAEVYGVAGGEERLLAKASATLALVSAKSLA